MIQQYLVLLESAGVSVEVPKVFPAVVSDPDDDPILQTAILGHAEVLCTRDVDFHDEVVGQVCATHGIRIVDDITLMQELRRSSAI